MLLKKKMNVEIILLCKLINYFVRKRCTNEIVIINNISICHFMLFVIKKTLNLHAKYVFKLYHWPAPTPRRN